MVAPSTPLPAHVGRRLWRQPPCPPALAALAAAAVVSARATVADAGEEGSCPAGGCVAAARGEYLYPHGRGHPRHFGQSPYSFGGRECNLSASLKWSWTHPEGRLRHIAVGKPIVDDAVNIYFATEDCMRKFSPDGPLLWTWRVPNFSMSRAIPNNPAIMDGLVFNCLTTGEVFALSMETGELVWMVTVSDKGIGGDTAFTVARDGMVILDVDIQQPPHVHNRIIALNSTSGGLLWELFPDTGVWNFLPLFPGDGTILFQSWTGAAHRVNLTNGRILWRAGKPPGDETWTDGGAALGPNGVFYTVSASGGQTESFRSKGGGLHAFRVSDGEPLWERTDFDQGIFTYPVVGRLGGGSELSVVTGVGSLGFLPLVGLVMFAGFFLASLGLLVGLGVGSACLFTNCCKVKRLRERAEGCRGRTCALALFSLAGAALGLALACLIVLLLTKRTYLSSVRAFDAGTGKPQWSVDLPPWRGSAAKGDAEGFLPRMFAGTRPICLPLASSYATLDAQGAFYMGHLDGRLYRIKDWDGNGRIEGNSELCSFEADAAFFTGGPTILPGGRLLASSCDTLYVFEAK